ncbi:hypothetical protein AVEN_265426-1 [Araneus ventricosus]|uniref:Uncharacterized protein n=1 Tax=Araneus ventricosus TaxID=182803 RepID=A0A4Y2SX94_ARAVE|nr:hypothetical protein AVEN_265426-1 [Araneus ventricosus]
MLPIYASFQSLDSKSASLSNIVCIVTNHVWILFAYKEEDCFSGDRSAMSHLEETRRAVIVRVPDRLYGLHTGSKSFWNFWDFYDWFYIFINHIDSN